MLSVPKRLRYFMQRDVAVRKMVLHIFPLLCPKCGGQTRLIASITEGVQIRRILDHIDVDSEPPHVSPARGPPLWEDGGDAQMEEGVHIEPDWELAEQPAPEFESLWVGSAPRTRRAPHIIFLNTKPGW